MVLFAATKAEAQPTVLERVHRPLTALLRTYVIVERGSENGQGIVTTRVRYRALKNDERWSSYTANLARLDPVRLQSASSEDLKAFWINTYNALVIDTILRNYPIRPTAAFASPSIQAIPKAWTTPHWVARKPYTLQDIEKILSKLEDGRVWFLVCPAARGGPMLRPYAITPSNVAEELESAAGAFCNDPRYIRLDRATNTLRVSDYLREKVADFSDPVRTYLAGTERYALSEQPLIDVFLRAWPASTKAYVRQNQPSFVFFEMDWELNDVY